MRSDCVLKQNIGTQALFKAGLGTIAQFCNSPYYTAGGEGVSINCQGLAAVSAGCMGGLKGNIGDVAFGKCFWYTQPAYLCQRGRSLAFLRSQAGAWERGAAHGVCLLLI